MAMRDDCHPALPGESIAPPQPFLGCATMNNHTVTKADQKPMKKYLNLSVRRLMTHDIVYRPHHPYAHRLNNKQLKQKNT
jgi:hypothetical protein